MPLNLDNVDMADLTHKNMHKLSVFDRIYHANSPSDLSFLFKPVFIPKYLLEVLHHDLNIPWWIAIVSLSVITRLFS